MPHVLQALLQSVFLHSFPILAIGAQNPDLAGQVYSILESRCAECHAAGVNEGGFGYALSRRRLVRQPNGLVTPGTPADSVLYQRILSDEMPPGGRPLTPEQKEIVRRWIATNAPDWDKESPPARFISPAMIFTYIQNDLEASIPRNQPYLRYFTITHLYNAGFSEDELQSYRNGLSKLVNSLSWGRSIRIPQPIDPEQTILRIDLRDYKWNENKAWDALVAADPYHVRYDYPSAMLCYEMTGSPLPCVRADWFVYAASRPPLYHTILGVPQSDRLLEQKLNVNVEQNIRDLVAMRSGFFPSGVSQSNRLIEWHDSSFGAYWKSYDFAGNEGRQNLRAHPLGPSSEETSFRHDGGEIIFSLPNGLQGYMLVDAQGNRLDSGPTQIVVDKLSVQAGRDPDVVNGVSCMRCHWSGIIRKRDQIREHVTNNASAFTKQEVDAVKAIYVVQTTFDQKFDEAAKRFARAVQSCGAPLSRSEPVATLAEQFAQPLDLAMAAAEAGVDRERFQKALQENAKINRDLGVPIPRDTYVQKFGGVIDVLGIGEYIPRATLPAPQSNRSHGFDGEASGDERHDNGLTMRLLWCPPGEFVMGSPSEEVNRSKAEEQVQVSLTQGFWIGKYEVTQDEWIRVIGTTLQEQDAKDGEIDAIGNKVRGEGARFPMQHVSWVDAISFCRKLTADERKAGRLPPDREYTLPTEAQWEYACRAGTSTATAFGDALSSRDANFDGNYPYNGANNGPYLESATPVGSYPPNGWGLHDMHGNVAEWCRDMFIRKLLGGKDPFVEEGDDDFSRVFRGGSWFDFGGNCRSSDRDKSPATHQSVYLGFRVAIVPVT